MGERGRFVWHELMTNKVTESIDFYTALFGWEIRDSDSGPRGRYRFIVQNDRTVGGIVPMDESRGVPCHWISHLTVDDVDAVSDAIAGSGGYVQDPPTDLAGVGRTSVVIDAWGAAFAAFRPVDVPAEAPSGPPTPGAFCWNELLTQDPVRSGEFYRSICGWSAREETMGGTGTYTMFHSGETEVAGMLELPADGSVPPSWLLYVAVAAIEETVARIERLGGRLYVPPRTIPGIGKFSVAGDATGATFAVFQSE
jgi:predicted enzyme related to lactoylglutathione lyase